MPLLGLVVVIAVALTARRSERLDADTVLALCGVAGVLCLIVAACVRPGFAPRYVTPAIPAFLFAIALWLRAVAARDVRVVVAVLGVWFATAIGVLGADIARPGADMRHLFELERPSAWLAESGPERMVLFWDGQVAARSSAAHLAEVGAFFFKRAGRPVEVDVARIEPQGDPNPAVLALARRDAAILWLANEQLPAERRPRLEQYDAALICRDFGQGQVTLTACRRR